jgi:CDP-diacylglycerol--glycerol-3-phosphate 3-phosphatidyltransferase
MNLPNKITISRIILSIFTLILLIIPWYQLGIDFKSFTIAGKIIVDSKYIIAGLLFVIASITDFLDGYLARSRNMVTDFGKVMDAIADKILVNGVLIILACNGFISVLVPVIIITRDTFVDSIKMASGNKGHVVAASYLGKAKTICMMVGVSLMLFYNLPFELVGLPVADILIIAACILSVISGCEYYYKAKALIFTEK